MLVLSFLACVLDRTGQSAPAGMQRHIAEHARRLRELEAVGEDMARRVGQVEEVTHARGQQDILRVETMEQLRLAVAGIRGELETLRHDYDAFEAAGLGFQGDADARLLSVEGRIEGVERSLGIKSPAAAGSHASKSTGVPPGAQGGDAATGEVSPAAEATGPALAEDATPDEFFARIATHLEGGNNDGARGVAERFVTAYPKHARVPEALYRAAESYQNAGEFKAAASAFQRVIDKDSASTWASWSMLRQGECFDGLGAPDKAKVFYCDVVRLYRGTKAAREAKERCGK